MTTRLGFLLALFLLVGCGQDGAGVPQIDKVTSLDPQKVVDNLSTQEKETLCSDVIAARKSLISVAEECTIVSVMAAAATGDAGFCKTMHAECMKNLPEGSCDVDLEVECTAKVSELDKCLVDILNKSKRITSSLSCDAVKVSVERLGELSTMPESCSALEDKCPDIITLD